MRFLHLLCVGVLCFTPSLFAEEPSGENKRVHERLRDLEKEVRELRGELDKEKEEKGRDPLARFNPRITIFGDYLLKLNPGGKFRDREEDDQVTLRETELDFRASIDPYARGVLIVAAEQEEPGSFEFVVEEGYLESLSLPLSLTAKAGRFRQNVGIMNQLHTHDLPTPERPLVHRKFFGEEGLTANGGHLSGLIPNPMDQYLEWTVEVTNSENDTLYTGASSSDPAYLGHLKWFTDLPLDTTLELGGSYLRGVTDADHDDVQQVAGVGGMLRWKPKKQGLYRSFLLQGEALWGDREVVSREADDAGVVQTTRSENERPFGWYALAQYQLNRRWYVGARYDVSEEIADDRDREKMVQGYVSLYTSEFLRFRLALEHHELNNNREDFQAALFTITWVFGAHPPHPYWVNR